MEFEIVLHVKAVGVTFKNDDGTNRQDILADFFDTWGRDLGACDIDLLRYEYQYSPAYHIQIDHKTIGNLPEQIAARVAAYEDKGYTVIPNSPSLIGGTIDDDWDDEQQDWVERQLNWGLSFSIGLISPQELQRDIDAHRSRKTAQANQAQAKPRYTYNPEQNLSPKKNKPKIRNVWKLIVGCLCLFWSFQLFMYSAAAFLIFGLLGGGLIFWWLLWDVYPKDKKDKNKDKSDHRRGPDLP